jgi:hypothetical protein
MLPPVQLKVQGLAPQPPKLRILTTPCVVPATSYRLIHQASVAKLTAPAYARWSKRQVEVTA